MSDKMTPAGTDSGECAQKPLSLSDKNELPTNIVSYGANRLKRLMVFTHANDTYIHREQSNNTAADVCEVT